KLQPRQENTNIRTPVASDLLVSRFAVVRSDSICDRRIRDENSKRYPVAKSLSFSVKECAGKNGQFE
ncbi:MAG: hypothetical protein KDI43_15000, partial [Gammaproteobacteria bacterium]|nr:hypothetical protein [Gammaproteobacteria bacterium]